MQVILKPEKIAGKAAHRVGDAALDYESGGHIGTGLQGWVGTMEIILFSSSIVFGFPGFIGVWLATKYVAAYKTWARDPVGRTFYNRSLFGTGLNILIGSATGGASTLAIRHTQGQCSYLTGLVRVTSKGAPMLQTMIGAVIAIAIVVVVERLRRPSLQLNIETPPLDRKYANGPAKDARFVRVKLSNRLLPGWARWMVRAPALQCRGTITFHHLDGQDVLGRAMVGRWASSPEPVPILAMTSQGTQIQIFDPLRLTTESRVDVYPGESELLDIAVRLDEEEDCYGWNNETYFCHTPWRNPLWKLPRGRYLVRVEITSSGQKCTGVFRLINDVPRADFRLEAPTQEDLATLGQAQ